MKWNVVYIVSLNVFISRHALSSKDACDINSCYNVGWKSTTNSYSFFFDEPQSNKTRSDGKSVTHIKLSFQYKLKVHFINCTDRLDKKCTRVPLHLSAILQPIQLYETSRLRQPYTSVKNFSSCMTSSNHSAFNLSSEEFL